MPYILRRYIPLRKIVFALGEGSLIFFAVCIVYFFSIGAAFSVEVLPLQFSKALLVTLVFQTCLYYFDLYDFGVKQPFSEMALRITQAFGIGCMVLGIAYFLFPKVTIATRVFMVGYLLIYVSILIWRSIYALVLERRMFTEPILVIGSGEQAEQIVREIGNRCDSGFTVVAQVGEGKPPRLQAEKAAVYADMVALPERVATHKVEKIVVALDDRRGKMPVNELMACKVQGVTIENGVTFYEGLTGKILVEKVNPSWIIFADGFRKSRRAMLLKRLMDLGLSAVGLILATPLALVSALMIKLESPGPVFYIQERIGEKGKIFKVLKFRSMRQDAEKNGPVWAAQNDSRITRFGGFMRKSRIDELPQLWNVFRNEMSFVGPRPERPIFVKTLAEKIPYYSLRHSVKPGLTGWAQIWYPYGASEEDALRKLEYDLYYIKNMSLRMDMWVFFETVKIILFRKGAR